ncbi:glycosyl hydrolase family 62 protein [Biscogniauxia sp. FL1348]|nr:glycosyl hydrolase family 62 protein [Biscogniauxia sp. FL1348]
MLPLIVIGAMTAACAAAPNIPYSFKWESSDPLISPKSDGKGLAGVKDPSIVEVDGTYHLFASQAKASGYNLMYLNFTDFSEAQSAKFHYLDEESAIGPGYRAAPQVFYFAPQKRWYLVYQNNNAAYSTNNDIGNPAGWTAPKTFFSGVPDIISQNIGDGYWVDMWVICDSHNCYLFSTDDNGHLYRASTSLDSFPSGFSDTVITMSSSNKDSLFEATNVYALGDGSYLLIVEAIGDDGNRYFRSWTANSLSGTWEELAASETNPFARSNNVIFTGQPWTRSISHGEMIRINVDQTMTISPCNLRYLYQGMDPSATGNYNSLPWKLALLTQTNSEKCI